jgi:hypothetical protein
MADLAFFEGRQVTPIPPAHSVTPQTSFNVMGMRMDCNPVGQIVVTPIVQDQNIGDYVRELRIFSLPTSQGAEPELLLAVKLHALTVKQLEIQTPASSF